MIKNLHQGGDAKLAGKQLHHWLIEPFEPWLQQQNVQNLVIVPDNVLRALPLAALYDGKQYLIERYAVASSAGLTVMKPQPMQHHKLNALLAGLSKPGTVIEHLPVNFLSEIATVKGYNTRELSETADNAQRSIELEKLMRQANFQQHVKDKLNLPAVAQEIETVSKQLPNTVLMNEQFTVTQFTQQIMNEPYAIVHIASHGVFGKTAASSFVMAYDNVIDMNLLESLFNTEKLKKQPIELLALNACETAEGDDRTPLGLSGVAIKTNVKSALGTLWSVSDDASYQIMTTFYKTLSEDKTSKVKALQQAQLSLLRNPDFKAPVFWASFILVGNWL
jgi:CHAT domain-containing protein